MFSEEIFGQCLYDYNKGSKKAVITVHSPGFDDDEIPAAYLMRQAKDFPALEKMALKHCTGKILDVGSCSGSHSKYLQEKGFDVSSLEIDPLACKFQKEERGIVEVINADIYEFTSTQKFDTILLLMNGLGIAGSTRNLHQLVYSCLRNLNPGGKIIFESADIAYLFPDEAELPLDPYYGEMQYQLSYNGKLSKPFEWLYLDAENMALYCEKQYLNFEVLLQGDSDNYLGVISSKV